MPQSEHVRFLAPAGLLATGFSPVATVSGGKTIYISGQVALDASGNLVGEDDFKAQAQQVFENLRAALAAAGADFSNAVRLGIFVLDRANLPVLREVRDQYVNTQSPPTSTLLIVAGLARAEFLLEVEAIAILPGES
ncbi:MAG TPA: RidA family protein [Ktedonobacterales bacterium]|jgi:enamine deaminase RidA (YjgF/YER057c/UK114 family)|nr:RidA family protein [Ktedonobacterales bacterium]